MFEFAEINSAEVLHEEGISNLIHKISDALTHSGVHLVLIAGPSASGKTTFAKRLGVGLERVGLEPVTISLDDYFLDRELTPLDENGEYDYETIDALDLKLFNSDLERLLDGKEVLIPKYSFVSGARGWHDKAVRPTDKSVLLVEGIHGLNPRLTIGVPDNFKFRIYISPLTPAVGSGGTMVSPTDMRLLRRMVRDNSWRGTNAEGTLARWRSVLSGEEKYIVPYRDNADEWFDSSLVYEVGVLKGLAENLLQNVTEESAEYDNAQRLLRLLSNFAPISTDAIPLDSILREFIGGGSFVY